MGDLGSAEKMKNAGRIVVLIFVLAKPIGAQTGGVESGDRVRFRTGASKSFHVASVARMTPDSLALESCATCDRLVYARSELDHLDVYRVRNRGERTLLGIFLGALIGGTVGWLMSRSCDGYVDACELSVLLIPEVALVGGLFGGIAGFLTGYAWQPVSTTQNR